MSKPALATLLALALALPGAAAAQTAAPAAASEGESVEQQMKQFGDDVQTMESSVIAKGIELNAEEAAAFWPLFKSYQAEQRKIMDGQVAAVRHYADHYKNLTDADAAAYVQALLDRDQQVHDLRVKYLAQYTKVVGQRRAARVIHISRKLGFAMQARLAEIIPIVR